MVRTVREINPDHFDEHEIDNVMGDPDLASTVAQNLGITRDNLEHGGLGDQEPVLEIDDGAELNFDEQER